MHCEFCNRAVPISAPLLFNIKISNFWASGPRPYERIVKSIAPLDPRGSIWGVPSFPRSIFINFRCSEQKNEFSPTWTSKNRTFSIVLETLAPQGTSLAPAENSPRDVISHLWKKSALSLIQLRGSDACTKISAIRGIRNFWAAAIGIRTDTLGRRLAQNYAPNRTSACKITFPATYPPYFAMLCSQFQRFNFSNP